MSDPLVPIITDAGLAAVLSADNDGLQAKITEIGLGSEPWSPDSSSTELQSEQTRVVIDSTRRVQDNQIALTAIAGGAGDYWVREVGFYLDDGTLLAVWSDADRPLAYKSSSTQLKLAFNLVLSALPPGSVTVIDGTTGGGQDYDPATETTIGVVRLATTQEAQNGSLKTGVAMSPASSRAHGDNRYARFNHDHLWEDIEDAPNAFPPMPHTHPWNDITDKPATFTPQQHNHDWLEIENTPSEFPPIAHGHGWSEIAKKPTTFPPEPHTHDQYIDTSNEAITSGLVAIQNRATGAGQRLWENFVLNHADVYPPVGFTMDDLQVFFANPAVIFFGGEVDFNDRLYTRWRVDNQRVRVICSNTENTTDVNGYPAYVNYFAVWRK